MNIKNLEYFRTTDPSAPGYSQRLFEALNSIQQGTTNIEQQTNSNASGIPGPPPPIASVTVTPTSVGHHISIAHPGDFYRGVEYHAEYATTANFTNPFPVPMGPAREHDTATGTRPLYWRAFAQYQTGARTAPVYHGGPIPVSVTGGASVPLGTSQGSGTGQPGEGLQGYGATAFRSATGAPPVRS